MCGCHTVTGHMWGPTGCRAVRVDERRELLSSLCHCGSVSRGERRAQPNVIGEENTDGDCHM